MNTQTTIDGLNELLVGLNSIIGKNDVNHYLAVVNYDYNDVDIEARKIASRIIRKRFSDNPETYYRADLVTNALEITILEMSKVANA